MSDSKEVESGFAPRVSIVIPVYNGSGYLRDAIDSALAQTYRNVEVIVVNDGSSDGGKTRAIALSYGDRLRYFEKENGGVSTALNLGIQKMTGDYFSWLSHDDLYYPHKIAAQIELLRPRENRNVILFSNFTIKNYITGTIRDGDFIEEQDLTVPALLPILFASRIHGCSALFPKRVFTDLGLFSEDLRTTQDYDFFFKLLKSGYAFQYIPEPLILTRHHNDQGTVTLLDLHVKEVNNLYIWAFELFRDYFQAFSLARLNEILDLMRARGLQNAYHHIREFRDVVVNKTYLDANKSAIWLYWENKPRQETPQLIELCWETIKKRNAKDFQVIITNPSNIRYYLPDLNPSVGLFKEIAHRADYIRFNLLYHYGGIWLDSDFVAFRSLKPVLEKIEQHGFVYTGYRQKDGAIFPIIHFLGSKKGHPILKALIENANGILRNRVALGLQPDWDEIGGYALQRLLTQENGFRYESQRFAPLNVHSGGQRAIYYSVKPPRRLRKSSFGQMLPYSACSQFLDYMGREIIGMNCYLSSILRKNIDHNVLYPHRFLRLCARFAKPLKYCLPSRTYVRLAHSSMVVAGVAQRLFSDLGEFLEADEPSNEREVR